MKRCEMYFEAVVAEQDGELYNRILRQRYDIYCVEKGYLDYKNYPDKKELDKFDAYSDFIAVLDESGGLAASTRFVHHAPFEFSTPTLEAYRIDVREFGFAPEEAGEVSRSIISPQYRGLSDSKKITIAAHDLVYEISETLGIGVWFGAFEKSFLRLSNIFGIRYRGIGTPKAYGGVLRQAAMLRVDDYGKELSIRKAQNGSGAVKQRR